MKPFSKMRETNIKNIKIDGWMLDYLKAQESGLTGNLDKCGYPFSEYHWHDFDLNTYEIEETATDMLEMKEDTCPHWWPYEQAGYLLDGVTRCGHLLNSKSLLEKAEKSFDFSLKNKDTDGFIGPRFLKMNVTWNKWPLVVFFRALLAHYSATKDESIIKAIEEHYLLSDLDYSDGRDVYNVEIMLLTYLETKNKALLEKAIATYQKYNEADERTCDKTLLSDQKPYEHGVSYNEYSKLGALLYICTGEQKYLDVSIAAYKKIDKYFMLASGLHCSNEYLRSNHYMQSHEGCDITDYTWALGYLLMATGDAKYADKIEKCVLNAGVGQLTEDFRALQYFSCPNQLIVDDCSNHNTYYKGENWMQYRPNHIVQCCPGNITRFFPNYCLKMYMENENEIFSLFFGKNEFETKLGENNIKIFQVTDFPFSDSVTYKIKSATKPFNLNIRIPKWSVGAKLIKNGEEIKIKKYKGFAKLKAEKGDKIELLLPSEIKVKKYQRTGAVVEKGPLVYSFGMYGERKLDTNNEFPDDFPVYSIYPDKDWNYALDSLDARDFKFKKSKLSGNPFDIRYTPLKILAPAKKINGWVLSEISAKEEFAERGTEVPLSKWDIEKFVFTPKHPSKAKIKASLKNKKETIELVPLASAKLRLTIFPITK